MNKWSANNAWSFEPLYGSECNVANIVLGNYTTTQNCQWGYWGDGAAMAWNTAGTRLLLLLEIIPILARAILLNLGLIHGQVQVFRFIR